MPAKLTRGGIFWSVALQGAIFGFFMGGFGPAQPLLQSDQQTSGSVAGLHGTALGIASIIAGIFNARLVHKFGRFNASWLGMGIFTTGSIAFVISPSAPFTIASALFLGLGLSLVVNTTSAFLSHHFAKHSTQALSQANAVSSFSVLCGTAAIGFIAGTSINWRLGLLLCLPAAIGLYLFARKHQSSDHVAEESGPQSGKLSRKYWLGWLSMSLCISSEFAIAFWAAALIRDRTGLSPATATICVLALSLGMATGRWFGPLVMKHIDIDQRLISAMLIQFIGFMIFWFSHRVILSFIGLALTGLGVSMQFALSTFRIIRLSENRTDLAMGRASLGAGIAIAGAPLLLGFLSDSIGISRGYLMVPILILLALFIVILVPTNNLSLKSK